MSAATTRYPGARKAVSSIDLPVKAATKILGGTIVCTDASGWAVEATATTGLRPWGKATQTVDNTSGNNGDLKVNVVFPHEIWLERWENDTGTPVVAADRGKRIYLLDNKTLTGDPDGNSPGPYLYERDADGYLWVWFEPAAGALNDVLASEVQLTDAGGLYGGATELETALLNAMIAAPSRVVRGVVTSNVASLASFTVAGNDGLTYAEGERVLLAAQTTAAQCGVYEVGAVNAGSAPLTRAADMPTGAAVVRGGVIEVAEGTIWAGSTWKATGGGVIGTNDPLYYPRQFRKVVTLASGTYTIGAGGGSEPLFLLATTSDVQVTRDTAGGTITTTIMYVAPVASRIAGKAGTAAVEVRSAVAAGTILNTDNSTCNVCITNW